MVYNIEKLKLENEHFLQQISENREEYLSFLTTMSKFHKYDLAQQVGLHLHAPKGATACATLQQWEKYFFRQVQEEKSGIPLVTANDKEKITYVYDVKDTVASYEEATDEHFLWKYKKSYQFLFDELVEDNVPVPEKIQYLCNRMAEEKTVQTDSSIDANLLAFSTAYIVLQRLDYKPYEYLNEPDNSMISQQNDIVETLRLAGEISQSILNPIGKYIKEEGRFNHGKQRSENPVFRNLVRFKKEISSEQSSRAVSKHDAMRGIDSPSESDRRTIQQQIFDFSGTNDATRKNQRGTEGGKSNAMGRKSEQRTLASTGNSDSGDLLPVEAEKQTPKKRNTKKDLFQDNIKAIYLLKSLEKDGREATPIERNILKKYVGFGGLAEAFDANIDVWKKEYMQLTEALTEDEYRAARSSVLNAHYTSDVIIKNMYKALETIGFQGGTILEPSCGTGNFFAEIPTTMAKNRLYGVELDSLTGRIAQKIYPDANITIRGFEKTTFEENTFDLAIGNVPFGDYKVNDPAYDKEKFLIHDYFLAKMIDKVRPGGLLAVITTKGTMDKKDEKVRSYLAQRANLIRAVRLPNTAFRNAGTEVTTDILIFQKNEHILDADAILPEWVKSNERSDGCMINSYFQEHPEHVLGTLTKTSTQYGFDLTCIPFDKSNLNDCLEKAFLELPKRYEPKEMAEIEMEEPDESTIRPFSFFYQKGVLYYQVGTSKEEVSDLPPEKQEQMRSCIMLRDAVRLLIDLQKNDGMDVDIESAQANLNKRYDAYQQQYGFIATGKEFKKLFEKDSSYPLLRSLEIFHKGEFAGKSDIFSKRTITPYVVPEHVDTSSDALIVSMQEKGKVDISYMETLTGISQNEIVQQLEYKSIYFNLETEKYELAEEYFSGDVRSKLEYLENALETHKQKREERLMELVLNGQQKPEIYEPKNEMEKSILSLGYAQPNIAMHAYIENSQDADFMVAVLSAARYIRLKKSVFCNDPTIVLRILKNDSQPFIATTGGVVILDAFKQVGVENFVQAQQACKDPLVYNFMLKKAEEYQAGNIKAFENTREELDQYKQTIDTEKNYIVEQRTDATTSELSQKIHSIQKNITALEKVKPQDLDASAIQVELGATWISTEDVENFIFETLETARWAQRNIHVRYSNITAVWNIEGKSQDSGNPKATVTYGTDEVNAYKIIENALNLRESKIYKTIYENGDEKKVINKEATLLVQQKQELIREKFRNWIWEDPDRRKRLEAYYNRHFNNIRPREYDGKYLAFPGMNAEIKLRNHQKAAIAHTLYGGNTLLAHCVGAGKTFEMVASAMEAKRLGLCKKTMIVVPKHLTEQFGTEFLQLYPEANILVAKQKDFETENRKEFCSKIATGEWDAIIMGYTQFEKISVSKERQIQQVQEEINSVVQGIVEIKENNGERFTIKQMESQRKKLEVRLEKLQKKDTDQTLTFEELGVDRLYVDEAHYFKNLFTATKMQNVAGVTTTDAQKTNDLYEKCRYLNEITNEKGIVFATGTPISNSMTELFTMQRYLQPQRLKRAGLSYFDAWAAAFGKTTTAIELSPEGKGFRSKTRFAKFHNLPELMSMFKEIADIKTADMLKLPVPEEEYILDRVAPTQEQKNMVDALAERAEKIRNRKVEPDEDNMLLVTNDGRKLALDQRLINPNLPDDPESKVNHCVKNIFNVWEQTQEKKLAQLVFCDLSTPGKGFNVYDDIKEKLIGKGVLENEIAFIHDAKTEKQKDSLFAKVRTGEIRVLIGSTAKMGTGTNVQDKLIALHDLDVPWRPSDLEQRRGRIIRQGNENKQAKIFRYVTEETFDAYLWQIIENKQRFIAQIMTSKAPVRSADDIDEATLSYAEIKAIATGNPLIKEKMEVDIQIEKLKMAKASYLQQKHRLEHRIAESYPQQIEALTDKINRLEHDVSTCDLHTAKNSDGKKNFCVTLDDSVYTDRVKAGEYLLDAIKKGDTKHLTGTYRGLRMRIDFEAFKQVYEVVLSGRLSYEIEIGNDAAGNMVRIDNVIEHLEPELITSKGKLEEAKQNFESAKIEVNVPFVQEAEFQAKLLRSRELELLLNADHEPDIENQKEQQKRLQDILNSADIERAFSKLEKSYKKAAQRELKTSKKSWDKKYDKKIVVSLLSKGYADNEVADAIFKYSPAIFTQEASRQFINENKTMCFSR